MLIILCSHTTMVVFFCVLVYVDYFIITSDTETTIAQFKKRFSNCFQMKGLGFLKYFLGIEVAQNSFSLYLSEEKYALDIISETGLSGAKLAATSVEQNHNLITNKGPIFASFLSIPSPDRLFNLAYHYST